jgi:O-methyltransferase
LVLADVDLTEPTKAILERFFPRLSPGGMLIVDDCQASSHWKARLAYQSFCQERGLPEQFEHGMGVVRAVTR